MWTGDSPTRSLTRRLESLRPSPRPPFDSDTQLKVVEVLYGYPVILTIHMTRSHTRLGQIIVCIPNHSPSISPLQEMAGFSPLGVLRDVCRPLDDSDPLPEPSDGILWPLFYIWGECRPVFAGRNVGDISNCYHRSSILHCSELHCSRCVYRGQDCFFPTV
ncbi:hypothetical protein BJV77DRAFT_531341 [Russula vinacea]|nr:hypothetical protein BJV77DRAFT_531341 [Russula vinacea]